MYHVEVVISHGVSGMDHVGVLISQGVSGMDHVRVVISHDVSGVDHFEVVISHGVSGMYQVGSLMVFLVWIELVLSWCFWYGLCRILISHGVSL